MGGKSLSFWGVGLILACFCVGCANCYKAPFQPSSGFLITKQIHPLTIPDAPLTLTGLKKETSESFYFCWPYPMQLDFAFGEPIALGKVTHPYKSKLDSVEYAELEVHTVIGLFGRYRVHMYGKPR